MKKPYIKWAFYVLLFLFNLILTTWALTQRVEAERQRELALNAREEAEIAKRTALAEKIKAESAKQTALAEKEKVEKSSVNMLTEIRVLKTELEICKQRHSIKKL